MTFSLVWTPHFTCAAKKFVRARPDLKQLSGIRFNPHYGCIRWPVACEGCTL